MEKASYILYNILRETGNSKEYTELLKKCDKLEMKLMEGLTDKQKELLEEIENVQIDMIEEKNKQSFDNGFNFATRLITEAFYNEGQNKLYDII